ncbi:MAG TPA: amino acid adenylation domain-containing protein [Pyrinomonadaceae bacterium]|nr:amino acid adenylation domain-containing protein [Pyrinomonadaceae bacterium]
MSTATTITHELIHEWFAETAARCPQAVAIECGERQLSYEEVDQRANTVANYLLNNGAGPGTIVALVTGEMSETIVGILGSLKAGAAFMPLDVRQPAARLRKLMELAPPEFLLTETKVVAALGQELLNAKVVCVDGPEFLEYHNPVAPRVSCDPDQLSYIYFTSGSTGIPKAIAGRLKGIAHFINWEIEELGVGAGVRVSQLLSPSFDGSLRDVFLPLCAGGTVCIPERREQILEGRGLVQWLEQARIEVVHCVPSVFRALVNEELRADELSAVRYVVMAGEALVGRDVGKWKAVYGERVGLVNLYGTSETTMAKFCYRVAPGDEEREVMPIGKPIPGAQALVLNSKGEPCKRGMVGEIYIRTPYRSLGYYNQPELTAAVFVPNPFSGDPNDLVHKTGDMGRVLEDGNFEYLGRRDEQVKVRGARVELKEVENAVRGQAGVLDVAVIEREDGSGYTYLCAYLVLAEGVQTVDVAEGVAQELPDYMVPSAYVELEELPRTISGKVDRRALPAVGAEASGVEYVAPRTAVEELLVESWKQLLARERIGIEDNFFRLGGHSLLATQVMSRVRETFGVEVGLRVLFERPTVRGLAEVIEEQLRGAAGVSTPAILPVVRDRDLPLSFAQQRLWFLDQLEPGSSFYNIHAAVRLRGTLDLTALEQSFREVIRRHESLRTRFGVVNGVPVQVIDEAPEFNLAVLDVSNEAEARRVATDESQRSFDLAAGPLLRASVLRLSEQEHVLLCTMHHIISDGWSMEVLTRDLTTLYQVYSKGEASPLPELPIQYADYAHWQREWLQGEVLETQLSYWKQQLAGVPTALELPTDYPRPAVQTFRGAHQLLTLSPELTTSLKALTQREGVTLFMTLLATFQTLLSRYSGQDGFAIGTPIAGRNRAETESLVGFFVNTLVLRTDLSGSPTFVELLRRVREAALGAYAHQDVPFELLVEELQPQRDMSRSPLFQVMMVFHNAPAADVQTSGNLELGSIGVENQTAKFDLTLAVSETTNGHLHTVWEYNTDLFAPATIERMMKHFEVLLDGVVQNPERQLSEFQLLTGEERAQVLTEWNSTAAYPQDKCIHQLLEQQVDRTPDAIAVVIDHAQITYRDLNDRANRLAHHLRGLGVGPETLVGICVTRSIEMVVGLLGILKAGGAYVPLDPAYPHERLSFMIEDARVCVLLTQQALLDSLPQHACHTLCLDSDWPAIASCSAANPLTETTPDDLAYVIYTSGSTGQPKGVLITHANVGRLFAATRADFDFNERDVWTLFHSFAFDFSVWELWGALLYGGRLVIVPFWVSRSPEEFSQLLINERVTVLNQTPSAFRQLAPVMAQAGSNTLRLIIFGGEALELRSLAPWMDQFGDEQPRLINMYGITETTVHVTQRRVVAGDRQSAGSFIGRALGDLSMYILDRGMQPVPAGVNGELYVGGAGVARGYLHRSELTAERFVPHPYSAEAGARLYRSGDVARYLANGEIEYVGRADNQVKVRGYRVELGELREKLNEHRDVTDSLVVLAGELLVGYYVSQHELQAGELRAWLRERVIEETIPNIFVHLKAIPLTINGKIDYSALPDIEHIRASVGGHSESARTPAEEILCAIWADLLHLERVSIHDNFFELGGHSLLATQLVSRIRLAFNVELPLRRLFEHPTVSALAVVIETQLRADAAPAPPEILAVARDGALPLSFAQQRLWFLDQFEAGSSFYHIPAAVRLRGDLDLEALEQSFREVIRRHESLRTRFGVVDGVPVQLIDEAAEFTLPVLDVSSEAEARRVATEESQRPFDLSAGPLLRANVLRLSEQEHVLVCTMHHIISDGWSMGVLIRELTALYEAYATGQESPLPELSIQYADYAHWQREWLQGEVLEKQLSYWKQQMDGAPPVLELPTDYPRPAVQTFNGAHQSMTLPVELTTGLKALTQREGVTLFMTLLAALQTLLWRYSGQEDIVVSTGIANRNRAETEPLIGFFVNTLVLRTDLSGEPSFTELLRRVREVTLGAYAHQDVPFELLVEALAPERDARYTPLFQVMLVLQNARVGDEVRLAGLEVSRVGGESGTAKFDLTMFVEERGEELGLALEYNTDLFAQSTIEQMLESFRRLVEGIVAAPEQSITSFEMIDAEERRRLTGRSSENLSAGTEFVSVAHMFEAAAARNPQAAAIECGERRLSYGELDQRANTLANYLLNSGAGPGTIVALLTGGMSETIVGILGSLKAGAAFMPLDVRQPAARLRKLMELAPPEFLLTETKVVAALGHQLLNAKVICVDGPEFLEYHNPVAPRVNSDPDQLSYIYFTSGSSGTPKAIAGRLKGIAHFINWEIEELGVGAGVRVSQLLSPSFDGSLRDVFLPLCVGGVVCVPERREQILEGRGLVQWLEQARIEVVHCVPSVFRALVNEDLRAEELSSLRYVVMAGEALVGRDVGKWKAVYGERVGLVNLYGTSETTMAKFSYRVAPRDEEREVMPIGKPIPGAEAYLLDERGEPCGRGMVGEIYIRTPYRSLGYYNQPELTAPVFVPNPFSSDPNDLVHKTGDMGRVLEDGNFEYLGRRDEQVKVRGARVELKEVENAVRGQAGVLDVAVIEREDGSGYTYLCAYLVLDEGVQTVDVAEGVAQELPDYMVPSAYVELEELPRTISGKVDRRALPAVAAEGSGVEYVAPRTAVEELLVESWKQLLARERVGVEDNFFRLGGHSLLATQVMSRVRETFGVEVGLRVLFEHPTVRGLGEAIEEQLRGEAQVAPSIAKVSREGDLMLSFAQQRLWFLDQLEPGSNAYNMGAAVRLHGTLDLTALEQSFSEVIRRHESLRTRFGVVNGVPVQLIDEAQAFSLPILDLSTVAEDEREAEARRVAIEESQTSFNLAAGPLFRVKVLRLSEHEHVLLCTMHHIISDGWSMEVLTRELTALYEAYTQGQESPLPELPIQYADYAHWQREWLQGERLDEQINYWRHQLATAPPVLDLPTDLPRPAIQSLRGARHSVELSKELSQALKELSRREGVTLFMTLLAGFQALLSRFSGQQHIVVGSASANRSRTEVAGLIGYFVNHLSLYTDISGDPGFRELLRRVRSTCFEAYAHQDVPFEKLLEELRLERDLRYSPLFQVMFVLHPRQDATSADSPASPSLSAQEMRVERIGANVDLNLSLVEAGNRIVGILEYRTDLFHSDTIEYLVQVYIELLEKAVAQPEFTLSQYELPAELQAKVKAARAREQKQTIAIAATFTAEPLEDSLKFWMDQLDLPSNIVFGPYNQVFQQLLDPSSLFAKNEHGVNVVLLRFEDWLRYLEDDHNEMRNIERHLSDLVDAFKAARMQQAATPFIVCVCPAADPERAALFQQMEELLASELKNLNGVYFVSSSELMSTYPVENYYDSTTDKLGHVPYTPLFFSALGTTIARKLQSLRRAPYKVIVLDCDQTLWNGVCAEDGALGIEPHRELQEFFVAQHDAGMLLCLCSKNQEEDVIEVFEKRSDMPLKRAHLASYRINWRPKSENIIALAQELDLGLDSFIFVDNDPLECAEVQARCPEVLTLELPQHDMNRFLRNVWAFDHLNVTAEDKQRTTLYQQNLERERFRRESFNLQEFLTRLELKVEIAEAGPQHWARVAQLTQRTNQFNMSTVRRTEAEVEQFCNGGPGRCLIVNVEDRFGSYGLVGVMIFTEEGDEAIQVETLLLSCRVLGRGVETRMLIELGRAAQVRGRKRVDIYYVPSKKNEPALNALQTVAGPYKERRGDGYVFKIPVEVALNLSPFTGEMPAKRVDTPTLKRVVEVRANSAQISKIANEFYAAEQVLNAIELQKQTARSQEAGVYIAPRTPIEEIMAEIWAAVLGVSQVGVNDNFFSLGGHSLLGTIMISRVRDALGVELPLLSLFESPTVAGLSEIIERSLIEQADADEMAQMMKELEGASEQEIAALLLSEGGQLE